MRLIKKEIFQRVLLAIMILSMISSASCMNANPDNDHVLSSKSNSATDSFSEESVRSNSEMSEAYSSKEVQSTDTSSLEQSKVAESARTEPANIKTIDDDKTGNLTVGKAAGNIKVDFAVRSGLPLFKRQSYCIYGTAQFFTYVNHLQKLRARSARFSLPIEARDNTNAAYEANMEKWMGEPDSIGGILRRFSTPLWHMAFVTAAIDPAAQAKDPANAHWYEPVYSIWNKAWSQSAAYMAKRNMRSFYEVWNEPDQPFWTKFDWDGYIRLYKNTALALRSGDPEAFVGGPAMSNLNFLGENKFFKFLDSLSNEKIPLDFYSMHFYDNDPKSTLTSELDRVRNGLASRGNFQTTQIIYTEFNIYTPQMSEWDIPYEKRKDFKLQSSAVVPKALSAIMDLNRYTDVTQVQWAWLLWKNGSFALIDSYGNRSPLYHALHTYAHMPTGAVKITSSQSDVRLTASADHARGTVLLWNDSEKDTQLSINMENIPFDNYKASVQRIDKKHSSYYETGGMDEFEIVERIENCNSKALSWTGKIPAGGTLFLSLDTEKTPELEDHYSIGSIIRSDQFYENRKQNSYSDYDDLTLTVLLGTGSNEKARGLAGVTLREVKDVIKVTGQVTMGTLKKNTADSCLGVRVDYHTASGYTKSVLYAAIEPSHSGRVMPWGTKRAPDVIKKINLNEFQMNIKKDAPSGWDGQILISFDMEDTGKWTEVKLKLR